jgi:molybdate transport system ATP-binding protein
MTTLRADFALGAGAPRLELDVEVDERGLVLVGPNGAGKTTTLLALLGLVRPARGTIAADGALLFDAGRGLDVPPEQRRLAYLPQDLALFPHLSAADNVAFGLAGRPRRARRAQARALLDRLGVGALADRRPATLSGGERQRVALARALAVEPRALLLDEPLAALDAEARAEVRAFLCATLRELGRPFIVVSHDGGDVRALGAPVVVLEGGRVVQRGDAAALARAPATPFVARLFAAGSG